MASAVTQSDWTSVDEGMLHDLRLSAQAMIISVAKTGSSTKNSQVLTFQKQWNVSKAMVVKALAMANGWTIAKATPYYVALKEDGGYGKNTAGALKLVVVPTLPAPPTSASGMPQYYAANASAVGQMSPADAPIVAPPVVLNPGGTTLPPVPYNALESTTPAIIAQTQNGYVQPSSQPQPVKLSIAQAMATQGYTSDQICRTLSDYSGDPTWRTWADMNCGASKPSTSTSPLVVVAPIPSTRQQDEIDFTTEKTPTTVVATAVHGDYKLIAIGAGGLALGGVLFWMLRKKAA